MQRCGDNLISVARDSGLGWGAIWPSVSSWSREAATCELIRAAQMLALSSGFDQCVVPIRDMRCGDVGVIVEFGDFTGHNGKIVQRYGNRLVSLGLPSGQSWPYAFAHQGGGCTLGDDYAIRILSRGEGVTFHSEIPASIPF